MMPAGFWRSRRGRTYSSRRASWASRAGSGRSRRACWCCSLSFRCVATGSRDSMPSGGADSWQAGPTLYYLILMSAAAMLSVLLPIVLLASAVAEKHPIPRIDQAVRYLVVKISAALGDSSMLAHCPVEFAAIRTQIARDLRWLQDHRESVPVAPQSHGAAIAHQVLKDGGYLPGGLRAFITVGQGSRDLTCFSAWTGILRCTARHGGAGCWPPPDW